MEVQEILPLPVNTSFTAYTAAHTKHLPQKTWLHKCEGDKSHTRRTKMKQH